MKINGKLIATVLVALGIFKMAKDGIPKEELQTTIIDEEDEDETFEVEENNNTYKMY